MALATGRLDYLADVLDDLRAQGLYRQLRVLEGKQDAVTTFDGREVINLSSNNYLGLNTHPRLRAAAIEAVERYGAGSGSVRTIAGTMTLHQQLEERLAEFKHTEATLTMQSGYTANVGAVSALLSDRDVVISDELNHASLIDGRGSVSHFGLDGRVDVQIGTLSKAMGALGGYVASTRNMRELLIHRSRPFLFSTSHPPAVAAACLAAIEVLETEPQLIETLWANTHHFKQGLERLGFDTGSSQTPITPVIVGEPARTMQFSDRLFENGVFAQGIAFPTVARDKGRVRTIVTAAHTEQQLQIALGVFEQVGKEMGII